MAKHRKFASLFVLSIAFAAGRPAMSASLGPISEETPPAVCDPGAFVTGIKCTGKYCDNIRIFCSSPRNIVSASANWTRWVSEETNDEGVKGFRSCPGQSYIAGLACNGKYCDKISLYCVQNTSKKFRTKSCKSDRKNTKNVSEEQGKRMFNEAYGGDGSLVVAHGVFCSGGYCDNKSFNVCMTAALP